MICCMLTRGCAITTSEQKKKKKKKIKRKIMKFDKESIKASTKLGDWFLIHNVQSTTMTLSGPSTGHETTGKNLLHTSCSNSSVVEEDWGQ